MGNPNLEPRIKELMELRRMKEELDSEIASSPDHRWLDNHRLS